MDSKDIEEFLNKINEAKKNLPLEETRIKGYENKTQDILHKFELETLSYHEKARTARDLAAVRQERRKSKDYVELITPIVVFYNNNKRLFDHMTQLLGELRKIEKRHITRTYRQRSEE